MTEWNATVNVNHHKIKSIPKIVRYKLSGIIAFHNHVPIKGFDQLFCIHLTTVRLDLYKPRSVTTVT